MPKGGRAVHLLQAARHILFRLLREGLLYELSSTPICAEVTGRFKGRTREQEGGMSRGSGRVRGVENDKKRMGAVSQALLGKEGVGPVCTSSSKFFWSLELSQAGTVVGGP